MDEYSFSIEVSIENKTTTYPIEKNFSIGSESGELVIPGHSIESKHLIIRNQHGVLSLQNLGSKGSVSIDGQKCDTGKVYLLDEGDTIKIGSDVTIKVIASQTNLEEDMQDHDATDEGLVISRQDIELAKNEKPAAPKVDEVTIARLLLKPGAEDFHESTAPRNKKTDSGGLKLELQKGKAKTSPSISKKEESLNLSIDENLLKDEEESTDPSVELEEQNEEEVEVDEDEEEQEEKKRPSPAVRRSAFGQNDRPKIVAKGKRTVVINPPGILARFFALCFEIVLIIALWPFFESTVNEHSPQIIEFVSPYIAQAQELAITHLPEEHFLLEAIALTETINNGIIWILCFLIVHLVTGFLFGISWPLFLLGYTDKGNFIVKRIKYILKTIASLFTTPFLIFDLPILFNKRPLKELIFGITYEKKRNALSVASKFILLPLILIICLLLPFVKDLNGLDGHNLIVDTAIEQLPNEQTLAPLHAEELFSGIITPKDVFIIPRFSLVNQGLRIQFFDFDDDFSLTLAATKEVKTATLLQAFAKNNYAFSHFFPKTATKLTNTSEETPNAELTSAKALKEVAHLITASLQFHILEAPHFLTTAGPWIPSYYNFRDELFAQLEIDYTPDFELKMLDEGLYLFVDNFKNEAINTSYILPIGNGDQRLIELTYQKQEKKFANQIKNALVRSYKGKKDESAEQDNSKLGAKVSVTLFMLNELEGLIPQQESLIIDFYNEISAKSIASNSEKFYTTVISSIEESIAWIEKIHGTHKSSTMIPSLENILAKLRSLLVATKSKDATYFSSIAPSLSNKEEQTPIRPE